VDIVEQAEAALSEAPAGEFSEAEVEGLPDSVRRHLAAAIAPGAPLAVSVRLSMRGRIKIGRWLPFRARELLNPSRGFVWRARVAGVLTGSDHYVDGHGSLDWKLLGIKTVVHAQCQDVSRSAAERAGAEAIWLPTALLPRFKVRWTARDDSHIWADYETDGRPQRLDLEVDADGKVRAFELDRWGDPDQAGAWDQHPFGGIVTDYASFGGLTIPSAGRIGWFYGTDRQDEGEFFRYQITALDVIGATTR
jgi:hypothetical protein